MLTLFEQMQGSLDVVVDVVTQTWRELAQKIDQSRIELKYDIAVLTGAIRQDSIEILNNTEDIRRLSDRLDLMAERAQLVRLEQRVTVLEQRARISTYAADSGH